MGIEEFPRVPDEDLLNSYKYYELVATGKGLPKFTIRGQPVTQDYIDKIVRVYNHHLVPELTERYVLESFMFCISSANTTYERPIKFIQSMKEWPIEKLYDLDALYKQAKHGPHPISKTHTNIFAQAIPFLEEHGTMHVAKELLAEPFGMREILVDNIKYISQKTASFIYLTFGGDKDVMTQDVHVCRQYHHLGIPLDIKFTLGIERKSGATEGRRVPDTLRGKAYSIVESQGIETITNSTLMEDFPVFRNSQGKLHGGLATTLLWNPGTEKRRGLDPNQMLFFEGQGFLSPYSKQNDDVPF